MATETIAPAQSGSSVAPATKGVTASEIAADIAAENGHTDVDDGNTSAQSVRDASKALREGKIKTDAVSETPTPAGAPAAPATADERPRNPDGTFAKVEGEATPESEPQAEPAEGAETEQPEVVEAEAVAPKVFKLAGEQQRGEDDIELDVSDLPPEVVERLERNEKQGMRRREFDHAMGKVASLEAQQVEVETRLRVNPEGFVLDNLAPAARIKVGAAILLEHWDEFAPDIEAVWNNPDARARMLSDLKNGVRTNAEAVQKQVTGAVFVNQMKRAINGTIPDGAVATDAVAYRAAAEAVIAHEIETGKQVTPETVPSLLASLAERYGFADTSKSTTAEPPKRPKLAVIRKDAPLTNAIANGTRQPAPQASLAATAADPSGGVQTIPSMSPERFAASVPARQAARNVAPQGAGATPVKRAGPPENATVEQASAWLKSKRS